MPKTWLSYCHLQRGAYQKNTNIWCGADPNPSLSPNPNPTLTLTLARP